MINKWKQITEKPSGRESVESGVYGIDYLKDIISRAEECGYKEVTLKIYDNGNIAVVFKNEEIEF